MTDFDKYANLNIINKQETCVMHQSFVSTCPPHTGKGGDNSNPKIKSLLEPLHCRDN